MPKINTDFVPLTFDDIYDDEYDKEHMGRSRQIVDGERVINIDCEDPHGFWYIHLEKGNLPEKLKGAYTTFDQALRDVNYWLANKQEPYIPSAEKKKSA